MKICKIVRVIRLMMQYKEWVMTNIWFISYTSIKEKKEEIMVKRDLRPGGLIFTKKILQ